MKRLLNPNDDPRSLTFDELIQIKELTGHVKNPVMLSLDWLDMPPQMVWNAQSLTWLDEYKHRHAEVVQKKIPGTEMTFLEYLEKGRSQIHEKQINASTIRLFQEYQKAGLDYVENNSETLLETVTKSSLLPLYDKLLIIVCAQDYWNQLSKTEEEGTKFFKGLVRINEALRQESCSLDTLIQIANEECISGRQNIHTLLASTKENKIVLFYKMLASLKSENNFQKTTAEQYMDTLYQEIIRSKEEKVSATPSSSFDSLD